MRRTRGCFAAIGLLALGSHGQGAWLAETWADACELERALAELDQAATGERRSFDGRLLRARLLIQLGRGDEALAEIANLRPQTPRGRDADLLLALALAQSAAQQSSEAEASLASARAAGADSALVDAAIAELHLSTGRTDEAEAMLRAVLQRAPDLTGARMNLAAIRTKQGHHLEAAALVRLAWRLGYQNPRELRTAPEFAQVRALGLIDDLIGSPTGRCVGFY